MLNNYQTQFNQIITQLQSELTKLRTSRATPALVEDITIEAYDDSKMRLKELASISIPEPRTIVITPWDKNIIKDIERGLINANLEFNPIVETGVLRINLPELTGETRERLVKKLHTWLEDGRIKTRRLRDEIKKEIEQQQKLSEITEDDKFKLIDELNKITKEHTDQIEDLGKRKEEEIMAI
jgi:ribosome recycling factor